MTVRIEDLTLPARSSLFFFFFFYLNVQFVVRGVTLDEVLQRPPDAVVHVVQLSRLVVGLWELQQTPAQQSRAERHGEVKLHVVSRCRKPVCIIIYLEKTGMLG